MADPASSDPIRSMLRAEAHAALEALAELGQTHLDSATLARRLDALGSAWGKARRTAAWSTGMEHGLDIMLHTLLEALGVATEQGMPPSELGARVAVVLADKAHPERPALLKAFASALNAGHVVMKPPKSAVPQVQRSSVRWEDLALVEGYRCSVCHGSMRASLGGPLCAQGHSGAELDPNADRPALRP